MTSFVLFLLFVASGAAALIYEVVWQQQLQLAIGSSTVSLGVLLATYMGGLCLGSLVAPRLIGPGRHPLKVYAQLEFAIGALALVLMAGIPLMMRLYVAVSGYGFSGVAMRALVAAACLLPPTMLMGATLPAVSRWVESTPRGMSQLGLFYAGNLAGAVLGTLGAGFYLLRLYDLNVATYVAVGINVLVGAAALALASSNPSLTSSLSAFAPPALRRDKQPLTSDLRPPTSVVIALSGFCALAAEIVWTRTLSLLFSATVYTFSIILSVFLIGLGLGGAAGSAWARRTGRPGLALAWCQLGSVVAMAWSAWALMRWLPYWPLDAAAAGSIWAVYRIDFFRAMLAILPAPIFWGASFPLALAARAGRDADAGPIVGRLYAANTLGAIAGAMVTSLVLVSAVGSQSTLRIMLAVGFVAAALMFIALGRRTAVAVAAVVTITAVLAVPPLPPVLVEHGRHAAAWVNHSSQTLYVGEGRHASIAVSREVDGVLNYHNAGKVQASSQPPDMRLQRMLGHLTTIVPRNARRVLVIGCGAGVTAGAVSVSPMVEQVTIVDIEPLVPKTAREYFGSVNHDVLKNPKVRVIADDARHFLMTTTEKFDAITSDPLDPWVKGAATLYTKEFFETARAHLNPGGVMTLFVQLYESNPEAVKSEVATFFEAFPEGLIFGNTFDGQAIDMVLVGQVEAPELYLDYIDEALRQPAFTAVVRSLGEIGLVGATDLFGNYAGRARDLKPWMLDAQINHDRDLRLQYLAGAGVNLHEGNQIYADILQYRAFPDDLFIASESTLWRLKQAMDGARE